MCVLFTPAIHIKFTGRCCYVTSNRTSKLTSSIHVGEVPDPTAQCTSDSFRVAILSTNSPIQRWPGEGQGQSGAGRLGGLCRCNVLTVSGGIHGGLVRVGGMARGPVWEGGVEAAQVIHGQGVGEEEKKQGVGAAS